ncbi:pancreatic progenitor cell differentiation and proliferation factor isoform X2 [Canis lupus baileyi]|uniref:pancreatic progenitor cell differentiation and proliferation factor isoform X2 n=1 Tax=Canis lupus dingo TaxID=286419 RepID=UPI000DC66804|nr:pancreatic progenitor cell differentiation and proliferation factor isoform X2 [Canis lupus dingo]
MAAIPSGGSLVATHDYYRRRLGSASGNSACGGADCAGEAAPQRPGEGRPPTAAAGPWWAGFFSGRSALASTATVLQSPARPQPPQASGGAGTGDSALRAARKQPGRQPGQADPGPPS